MACYLLQKKPGAFLLSGRFTQDPIESFFGQQRARAGSKDNPTQELSCIMLKQFEFKELWQKEMGEMCKRRKDH